MSDKTTEESAEETDYDVLKKAYDTLSGYCTWQKEQRAFLSTTISQLREENERYQWVSVEDRLPDKGQKCLIIIMYNGFKDIKIDIFKDTFDYYNVTHWMPLPSPPTKVLTPKPPKTNG